MSEQTITRPTSATMRVNPLSTAKLMRAVISLYGDQWHAVLREYSSNALDARNQAGSTLPVEITLPSYNHPNLIIEDHGIGLSWDDIYDIYVEVGTSTKEGDHTQIGHYGFGAKSGIMVADRFTMRTRKDGFEYRVECVRNDEGIGVFNLLSQHPTKEGNGVQVTIPAAPNRAPLDETEVLRDFFTGWPVGSVLINGKAPIYRLMDPSQFEALTYGNSTIGWVATEQTNQELASDLIRVSLGGVIYPLRSPAYGNPYLEAYRKLAQYKRRIYLNAPIESIEVTPSRESIANDPKTVEVLKKLLEEIIDIIEFRAQQRIEAQPTREAAWRAYLSERDNGLWMFKKLTYRGQVVPQEFELPTSGIWEAQMKPYTRGKNTYKAFGKPDRETLRLIDAKRDHLSLVKVKDDEEANRLQKSYAMFALGACGVENRNGEAPHVYFHTMDLSDSWLSLAAHVLSIPDYRAQVTAGKQIKLAEKPKQQTSTYTVFVANSWYHWNSKPMTLAAINDLAAADSKPLLAIRKGAGKFSQMFAKPSVIRRGAQLGYNNAELFRSLADKHTLVLLNTQTLIEKFEKEQPGVPEFDDVHRQLAQDEYDRVLTMYAERSVLQQFLNYRPDGDYSGVTRRRHVNMINFALKGKRENYLDRIQQPKTRAFFAELSDYSSETIERKTNLLDWYNMKPERDTQVTAGVKELVAFADNYPLFTFMGELKQEGVVTDHLIAYLNSTPVTETI